MQFSCIEVHGSLDGCLFFNSFPLERQIRHLFFLLRTSYEKKAGEIHICYVSWNNCTVLAVMAEIDSTCAVCICKVKISSLKGR